MSRLAFKRQGIFCTSNKKLNRMVLNCWYNIILSGQSVLKEGLKAESHCSNTKKTTQWESSQLVELLRAKFAHTHSTNRMHSLCVEIAVWFGLYCYILRGKSHFSGLEICNTSSTGCPFFFKKKNKKSTAKPNKIKIDAFSKSYLKCTKSVVHLIHADHRFLPIYCPFAQRPTSFTLTFPSSPPG